MKTQSTLVALAVASLLAAALAAPTAQAARDRQQTVEANVYVCRGSECTETGGGIGTDMLPCFDPSIVPLIVVCLQYSAGRLVAVTLWVVGYSGDALDWESAYLSALVGYLASLLGHLNAYAGTLNGYAGDGAVILVGDAATWTPWLLCVIFGPAPCGPTPPLFLPGNPPLPGAPPLPPGSVPPLPPPPPNVP